MGGLPTSTVNGFAVDPSNPKVMYVAMRRGVFRTENAGESWTALANGPKDVAAVAVNPKKPTEVYAATMDGVIHVSSNGGLRWERRR
ncbi:MAG: WD40/YVTN/BNR-like repeat-containing protein [Candidatus Rokuibacteriota bacterium]